MFNCSQKTTLLSKRIHIDGEVKPFKGESKKHESKVKGNKKWTVTSE